MAIRDTRLLVRKRTSSGGALPSNALFGEPFINTFDGIMRFTGTTGGSFETTSESGVFEVGSSLYNSRISNRLSINNNFIISGGTGLISTYGGTSGPGMSGKFLSGTTEGFVLGNIADIISISSQVQGGANTFTGGTTLLPTINITGGSFDNITVSGTSTFNELAATSITGDTIYSATTDLETIIRNIAAETESDDITRVQEGSNTFTGGTDQFPTVNITGGTFDNITVTGDSLFNTLTANTVNSTFFISGGTDLQTIISNIAGNGDMTEVQPGTNITTGGTALLPTINLIDSPSIDGITISGDGLANAFSATTLSGGTIFSGSTDLSSIFLPAPTGGLTPGEIVYVGTDGIIKGESGFEYDEVLNITSIPKLIVGDPSTTGETTTTVYGNILLIGDAISAVTSQLYIEDNRLELNFNPTASTVSTSLGAGWSIQDGSGIDGTDAFFDIRGSSTGVDNRSFTTNLEDLRIRESGTFSSPNGVRVLTEQDILDGGSF